MRRVSTLIVLLAVQGVGVAAAQDGDEGSGDAEVRLHELEQRVEALGGTVDEAAMDRGTYDVRLEDLEHQTRQLSSDVAASERRLASLLDRTLQREAPGLATIRFENRMGPLYRLVGVTLGLDGSNLFRRLDPSGVGDELTIYDGAMRFGEHVLSVRLDYVGESGSPFPYLGGYRMSVHSSYSLATANGQRLLLRILGQPAGGPATSFEARPSIRFLVEPQ